MILSHSIGPMLSHILALEKQRNRKSLAMNVERDFILQTTGVDRSRLDWTESLWNQLFCDYGR